MKKAFRLSCVMQDYRANRHLNCRYLALRNKELTQHIPGRHCGLESYFLGKNARPCGLESYFTSFFLTAFRQFAHSKPPLCKDRDGSGEMEAVLGTKLLFQKNMEDLRAGLDNLLFNS